MLLQKVPHDLMSKRTSESQPETLASGKYRIINLSTGGHAALLDDHDQSEVVTIKVGLQDEVDRGHEVSSSLSD